MFFSWTVVSKMTHPNPESPVENRQRTTESILKVLRKNTPDLRHTYNKYLKTHWFGGKVTFQFVIRPNGKIKFIYLLGNTSGDHDFALSLLEAVNQWSFEETQSTLCDVV